MRILVLSDSHHKLVSINEGYDYIIHCGDYGKSDVRDYVFVRGNCDFNGDKQKLLEIDGKKILVLHGDMYNVKFDYQRLVYKAIEMGVDICLFGHTHRPTIFIENDILFLNPGAYCDDFYAVITKEHVEFYMEGKAFKRIDYKW